MAYKQGHRLLRYTPRFLPFVFVFHLLLVVVRVFDWLVYRLQVSGRENLFKVKRAVLVSNHTLVVDPGVIAHAIRPRRTYYTMLEETALIPFLGTFVRLLGGIPIPQRSISLRHLETAIRRALGELGFVHFFPEGECYLWSQQIQPFRPGAFYLALRLGLPIIPITTVLHERHWFGRCSFSLMGHRVHVPPRVRIAIQEPVYPEDLLGGIQGQLDPTLVTRPKHAACLMGNNVRQLMQATVDRYGGSKRLSKGKMPRLALHEEDRPSEH